MPLHVPPRLSSRSLGLLLLVGSVCGGGLGAGSPATAGAARTQVAVASAPVNGSWQAHRYLFQYLAYNTTYGCVGLAAKLRLLLTTMGARDLRADPVCLGHPSGPELVPEANLTFQSLQPADQGAGNESPAGAGATAPGVWRHVTWSPDNPQTLGHGDCTLVQEVIKNLLPMFAVRNLKTKFDCAQNHDYGSFIVSFDAFAPAGSS